MRYSSYPQRSGSHVKGFVHKCRLEAWKLRGVGCEDWSVVVAVVEVVGVVAAVVGVVAAVVGFVVAVGGVVVVGFVVGVLG